jgi:cytochrome c-type biogenesis protein CcmE
MVAPEEWYGKPMNLHGFVVPGSIEKRRNSLDYRFKIESQGHVVTATYTGTVPDTFKDGSEVVLTGTLAPDGFKVNPNDGVTAKCPSRYDPDQKTASPGTSY